MKTKKDFLKKEIEAISGELKNNDYSLYGISLDYNDPYDNFYSRFLNESGLQVDIAGYQFDIPIKEGFFIDSYGWKIIEDFIDDKINNLKENSPELLEELEETKKDLKEDPFRDYNDYPEVLSDPDFKDEYIEGMREILCNCYYRNEQSIDHKSVCAAAEDLIKAIREALEIIDEDDFKDWGDEDIKEFRDIRL